MNVVVVVIIIIVIVIIIIIIIIIIIDILAIMCVKLRSSNLKAVLWEENVHFLFWKSRTSVHYVSFISYRTKIAGVS